MSQSDWDYFELVKQDIIDGKTFHILWDFEKLKNIDDTLTEEEMKKIFKQFNAVYPAENVYETVEYIIADVISEREKTTV